MKDISETPEFIGKFCQCGLSGVLGAGIRVPPVLSQDIFSNHISVGSCHQILGIRPFISLGNVRMLHIL
ncbi:hypothetical protein ACSQ67_013332 [Phaseolus vulgaris]